jgi:hypothetical protein
VVYPVPPAGNGVRQALHRGIWLPHRGAGVEQGVAAAYRIMSADIVAFLAAAER